MCSMTHVYYAPCNHWGARRVETPCLGAEYYGMRSGCWNNTLVGITRLNVLCPACSHNAPIVAGRPAGDGDGDDDEDMSAASRSSVVSLGTRNISTTDESEEESESDTSHTCSELSVDVEEEGNLEKDTEEGNGEAFGTRFGGWVNYTPNTTNDRSDRSGEGTKGFGTRFGGWANSTASNSKNMRSFSWAH